MLFIIFYVSNIAAEIVQLKLLHYFLTISHTSSIKHTQTTFQQNLRRESLLPLYLILSYERRFACILSVTDFSNHGDDHRSYLKLPTTFNKTSITYPSKTFNLILRKETSKVAILITPTIIPISFH